MLFHVLVEVNNCIW